MKNLLIVLIITIVAPIGCKKKSTKPNETANFSDLVGSWVSIDSSIMQDVDGSYSYQHDTIKFNSDTLLDLYSPWFEIVNEVKLGGGFYSMQYYGQDCLLLNYRGPTYIFIPDNNFRHKVEFSSAKDTLSIIDLKYTYPYRPFSKFTKTK